MAISVTAPVGTALERTGEILFRPFDIGKWFVLGFCAFLAQLGQGFGSSGGSGNWNTGDHSGQYAQDFTVWVNNNLGLVVVLGFVVFTGVIGLTALFLWLASRGEFMFIDGLAKNRGAVSEPWAKYKDEANRLFLFRFVLALGTIVAWTGVGAAIAGIMWPHLERGDLDGVRVGLVLLFALLGMIPTIFVIIVSWFLHNFVIPTMYLRGGGVTSAWRIAKKEILSGRGGDIFIFFSMRVLLALVVGVIAFAATCLTCCIVAIPYIGTVILLPLYVFSRCHTLYYLEQFGDSWRFFQRENDLGVAGDALD